MKKLVLPFNTPTNFSLSSHLMSGSDDFLHSHDFFEIFYISEGSITHICNNVAQTLTCGDMIILRPKDTHYFQRKTSCTHRDILIASQKFKEACEFLRRDLFDTILNLINPPHIKLTLEQIQYFEQILEALNSQTEFLHEKRLPLERSCLCAILGTYFQSESHETQYPKLLKDILTVFNRKEYLKFGLKEMSNQLGYSQIYLCRYFKKQMGITMTEYLNNVRLSHVVLSLQTTNIPITEICEELGFESYSYFSKLFKNKYGKPPSSYRKKIKNQ